MEIKLIVNERLLFRSKKHTTCNEDLVFYSDNKLLKLSGDYSNSLILELSSILKEENEGGDETYDLD